MRLRMEPPPIHYLYNGDRSESAAQTRCHDDHHPALIRRKKEKVVFFSKKTPFFEKNLIFFEKALVSEKKNWYNTREDKKV